MNNSFKNTILFLFFIFSSVKAEVINEISIYGLDNISRGTILSYLPYEKGDEIKSEDLQKILDSLKATNFFKDISINFDTNILNIKVLENPTIKFIEFKGYKDDEVLSDELISNLKKNFSVEIGKIYNEKSLKELVDSLLKIYENFGFYNFKLNTKLELDSKNRLGIILDISEGSQALIKSFEIKGNNYFESDDLLDLFEIGEPDFFLINFFTEKDKFDKNLFDAGIEKIKTKYLAQGYLDIHIEKPVVAYSDDYLSISIEINEGKQYFLNNIEFKGDLFNYSQEYLRSFFSDNLNEYFARSSIIKSINSVNKLYLDAGYAFSNSETSFRPTKEDPFKLDLIVDIKADRLIYVNRIVISGNYRTQDDVIRREIKLLEGSRYSQTEFDNSILNIKRLGYFSDVRHSRTRVKNDIDKIDLYLEVDEAKTGEISIGLSHSSGTGGSVNAGIKQSNILGTGNVFNASISNSDAVQEASFYFSDPYFNNSDHQISYGMFTKSLDAANLDTSSYLLDETGFSFGYGIPIDSNSNIDFNSRFSNVDLTCGTSLAEYEASQCSSNYDLDANFSIGYSHNSLNDFYFPTNGNKKSLKATLSLPGSDFKYLLVEGKYRIYEPVLNDSTLKFSSRFNIGAGLDGEDLFFTKRFFEGGASSVRGFDFNSLGTNYPNGKAKGGELSYVSSLGLSSKLDALGIDNKNMRITGFVDAGTISEKYSDVNLSDLRVSSGVEFTWLTPIGPVSVYGAYPIIKKSNDSTETFSFELGTTF